MSQNNYPQTPHTTGKRPRTSSELLETFSPRKTPRTQTSEHKPIDSPSVSGRTPSASFFFSDHDSVLSPSSPGNESDRLSEYDQLDDFTCSVTASPSGRRLDSVNSIKYLPPIGRRKAKANQTYFFQSPSPTPRSQRVFPEESHPRLSPVAHDSTRPAHGVFDLSDHFPQQSSANLSVGTANKPRHSSESYASALDTSPLSSFPLVKRGQTPLENDQSGSGSNFFLDDIQTLSSPKFSLKRPKEEAKDVESSSSKRIKSRDPNVPQSQHFLLEDGPCPEAVSISSPSRARSIISVSSSNTPTIIPAPVPADDGHDRRTGSLRKAHNATGNTYRKAEGENPNNPFHDDSSTSSLSSPVEPDISWEDILSDSDIDNEDLQISQNPETVERTTEDEETRGRTDSEAHVDEFRTSPHTLEQSQSRTEIFHGDISDRGRRVASRKTSSMSRRRELDDKFAEAAKANRDVFLVIHRHLLLPLLPERNYVISIMQKLGSFENKSVNPPCTQVQPNSIKANLKDYQLKGLEFLLYLRSNGMPAILADEMGLGKTLQTLSLLQSIKEKDALTNGSISLVVCPLSVLNTWMKETKRFAPELNLIRFHGSRESMGEAKGAIRRAFEVTENPKEGHEKQIDIVLTTYEVIKSEVCFLNRNKRWDYIILDEGHRIKNDNSLITRSLRSIPAVSRLILTGTPLQNDLSELWSLFHWMLPDVFSPQTEDLFKASFALGNGTIDTEFINRVGAFLNIIMLRRTKADVDICLPPKEEEILFAPLTSFQRSTYLSIICSTGLGDDAETNASMDALAAQEDGRKTGKSGSKALRSRLNNIFLQLRLTCIHPYLLPDRQPDPYEIGAHVLHTSIKFVILEKLVLQKVLTEGQKMLIFCGYTTVLDLCEDLLHYCGGNGSLFKFVRLDGSTSRALRDVNIEKFQDATSSARIMLISTKAGGQGLNLTCASQVVFLDEDFNPQTTLQAEARAHRLGQTREVTIYKILTRGTVEEQSMSRIRKKLYLSAKIDQTRSDSVAEREDGDTGTRALTTSQVLDLLQKGTRQLVYSDGDLSEIATWDLETLLEEFREKYETSTSGEAGSDQENRDDKLESCLSKIERIRAAVFEGQKYERPSQKAWWKVGSNSNALPTTLFRQRKPTVTYVDGYAVSAESAKCKNGEAVPTLTGENLQLKNFKRPRKPDFLHEQACVSCKGSEGDLAPCASCPRSFHMGCIDERLITQKQISWRRCSQHKCSSCLQHAALVGGLILCCRDCELAFCIDCIAEKDYVLLDDTLPQFNVLGFVPAPTASYIICHFCVELAGGIDLVRERPWEPPADLSGSLAMLRGSR